MKFAELLDHLASCIAVVGDNGVVRYRNRAFEEAFGSDAEHWLKEASRAVAGERGWPRSISQRCARRRSV